MWLILHIGGEPLLDRFLSSAKTRLVRSSTLTIEAKSFLSKCVEFLINEKHSLKRIHNSLFYIDGKFYNVSNRISGIQYVSNHYTLLFDIYNVSYYRYYSGNGSKIILLLEVLKFLDIFPYFIYYLDLLTRFSLVTKTKCLQSIKIHPTSPKRNVFCVVSLWIPLVQLLVVTYSVGHVFLIVSSIKKYAQFAEKMLIPVE